MAVIDSDALKERLKRFANSLPSNAETTVRGLVDTVCAIIDAEVRRQKENG